jgi:hypothetical protein
MNIANKTVNFFTSLRLTVVCLTLALGLVFIGTLAQVNLGLYIVQERFFHSFLVWWHPKGASWQIPVWPGGYLLGTVLLVNLVAAHIKRFEVSRKKIGIFVVHAGLILLLLGQLFTEIFQVESYMYLPEGTSKNYTESGRKSELAIVDMSDPKEDQVYSIPERMLAKNQLIADPKLPFRIKVESYSENSLPVLHTPKVASTGNELPKPQLKLVQTNLATAMDDRNIPVATLSIETDEGRKGPFTVSNWLVEQGLITSILKSFRAQTPPDFAKPQNFTYKGHDYEIALRPTRYYKPYSVGLIDFTHEVYKGTDTPKNFASRVHITRPETGENREVLIYMNNPLRYAGETFYQGGFDGETTTILQVVKNPGWLTPYLACAMVGAGLLIQFLSHLISFARKRSA